MNKIISIDIYDTDLMVHFGSKRNLVRTLRRRMGKGDWLDALEDIASTTLGKTLLLPNGAVVLWMPRPPKAESDMGTLAHEVFHAAFFIMQKVGITLSPDCDEAYAYLIGYITKSVLEAVTSSCDAPSPSLTDASLHSQEKRTDRSLHCGELSPVLI